MKKLFLLLLIALPMFVSCGDDDKEETVTYYDSVPLEEGKWHRIDRTDSIVLLFKDSYMTWITYDKDSHYEKMISSSEEYSKTDTMIFTYNNRYHYVLEEDTLLMKPYKMTNYDKFIRLNN